jgi:hypothetical protein
MFINNKEIKLPDINFNTMCDLESMGVSIVSMQAKPLITVRAFTALAMNADLETAGKEVEQHLFNGGKLLDMLNEINKAVEDSGFFQKMLKNQEKTQKQN